MWAEGTREATAQFGPEVCDQGGAKWWGFQDSALAVYELSSGPHVGRDWWQLAVEVWICREPGLATHGEGLTIRDLLQGASGGDELAPVLQHLEGRQASSSPGLPPSGSGLHEPWKENPLRSEWQRSICVCAVSARCRVPERRGGRRPRQRWPPPRGQEGSPSPDPRLWPASRQKKVQ